MIEFGRNANQISHTFRHTDVEGIERGDVIKVITAQLGSLEDSLITGPYMGDVLVKGVQLEFRAYRFDDGNIHVGRITVR